MGYLVDAQGLCRCPIPFIHNGEVFGADSDDNAGRCYYPDSNRMVDGLVPDGIDGQSLSIATGVRLHDDEAETSPWDVLMSDEATVVILKHGATSP